ncbi:MAG: EamA family transporter [Gaiellaceae bacterium]
MLSLLALGGALSWGAGDFLAGLAVRRIAVLTVLAFSQAIGLLGIALWVWLARDPFPGVTELLPAALAGLAGAIGLGALYRGLAVGAMGIVAPISAVSPIVPLAVDAARGVVPAAAQWLGVALVLTGIVTLSRGPSGSGQRMAAGAGLAIVAALGFGLFFVGLDAGADESAPWAVVAARSASVTLAVAAAVFVTRTSLRPPLGLLPALVAIGVFDTGANVLVAYATTKGAVGILAVLSALYPVVTVVLARLVLGEQLSISRRAGGVVALENSGPMDDAAHMPARSRLELGALIMLATLGFAAVVGFIAVIAADGVAAALGTGLGIAFFIFLTGGTLAVALASLRRRQAEIVALVSIAATGLAMDMLVLAIWLDIDNEAYAKIAGVAFVWSFYALIALGLTVAVGTARGISRSLYLGAVVVTVIAGLISAWLVVSANDTDVVSSAGPESIPGAVLGDDDLLRALGAALVLLAALWFGTLAASRLEGPAADDEQVTITHVTR